MNKDEFISSLKKINIELNDNQIKQFEIYCNYLQTKNKEYNLTAIKETKDIYLKHFYDCLTIINSIELKPGIKVLDVGTGAGFPGLVIKIIYPLISLTLLDSNNKKINFLKELANLLKLTDINFVHSRSEEYYLNVKDSFDYVVSRAVSNLPILTELCLPFVKVGGYFISMKAQAKEEIANALDTISILGGEIDNIYEFKLPFENSQRTIINIKKIKKTPSEYPRRYDKIVKYPLKKNKK